MFAFAADDDELTCSSTLIIKKTEILRMEFSIMEHDRGPQEIIFKLI